MMRGRTETALHRYFRKAIYMVKAGTTVTTRGWDECNTEREARASLGSSLAAAKGYVAVALRVRDTAKGGVRS